MRTCRAVSRVRVAITCLPLLLSLPFPPSGADAVRFLVLAGAVLLAALVSMRELQSPLRFAWWSALGLAVVWLVCYCRILTTWIRMVFGVFDGYDVLHGYGPSAVLSYSIVTLTIVAQAILQLFGGEQAASLTRPN